LGRFHVYRVVLTPGPGFPGGVVIIVVHTAYFFFEDAGRFHFLGGAWAGGALFGSHADGGGPGLGPFGLQTPQITAKLAKYPARPTAPQIRRSFVSFSVR
jgi:hypothetical protein